MLLTPVTGDVLADVLTTGALPGYADAFTARRFEAAPVQEGAR